MDRTQALLRGMLIAAVLGSLSVPGAAETPSASNGPSAPDLLSATPDGAETLSEMPLVDPQATSCTTIPRSSPLPYANLNKERSTQLEQVAQQADRQVRHGFELAGRGAYFAARTEFIAGLQLIADGLDAEQKTSFHARALAAGLTAIKEAEDFLPGGTRAEADLHLQTILAAHRTPVLNGDAEGLTPLMAMRCYSTFAQEQLAAAAGREVAGSMALHALGKLHAALADKKAIAVVAAESKAVVYYQAALLAYPKNFMAANDLGVLLARAGDYNGARAVLQHSVAISPQVVGWQNLATVYRQLGQAKSAEHAFQQATLLRQRELAQRPASSAVAKDIVRWVDPHSFARTSTNAPGATPVMATKSASANLARPSAQTSATGAATLQPSERGSYASPSAPPASWPGSVPAATPAAAQRQTWTYR